MMGWGVVMMVVMVLFWVVVIVAAVLVIRHLLRERGRSGSGEPGSQAALEVLERRFAQGEIGANEYRERRSILDRGG